MPYPSPELYPSYDLYPGDDTPFIDGVLASMAPWLQNDVTGVHAAYIWALGSMFEQVYDLVYDQGSPDDPTNYTPGYGELLNVETCPTEFLPYLGTFVGVYVPPNTGDATARALIQAEAGFARGTPAAIVATAQQYLIGTQSCSLIERTPTPYHFQLIVRPEEITNTASLVAAVNAVKPGGVQWTLNTTDGWTIYQMENAYASIAALEAAFATVTGLEQDQTGH